MLQSLIDFHPLRLYFIIGALLAATVFIAGRVTGSRRASTAFLILLSVVSTAPVLFSLGIELFPYLTSPLSLWPLEPQILSVSALAARGDAIYPDPETGGAIYGQVYGPGAYLFYGWTFKLFGAGYLQAKVATLAALILAFACGTKVALSVSSRRLGGSIVAALIAWIAYWGAYVYGTRPESILLFGVGLACVSVTITKRPSSLFVLGLGTAIAISVKPSAALYVAPIYVLMLQRQGILRTFSTGILSTGAAFLPFLLQQADFATFQKILENVRQNFSLKFGLLPSLLQTAVITSAPLAILCGFSMLPRNQANSCAPQAERCIWWIAVFSICVCQFAIGWISLHLLAASHHWAPFIFPVIALFATCPFLPSISKHREYTNNSTLLILLPWTALCLTLTLVVTLASYRSKPRQNLRERAEGSREIVAEIRQIAAQFAGKTIHMDWGEGPVWDIGHYPAAYRSALVFQGNPYVLEPSSVMEWALGDDDIDGRSAKIIADTQIDLWLVPKGQKPLHFLNSYTKAPTLGEASWSTFERLYTPASETAHFDTYSLRNANGTNQIESAE